MRGRKILTEEKGGEGGKIGGEERWMKGGERGRAEKEE